MSWIPEMKEITLTDNNYYFSGRHNDLDTLLIAISLLLEQESAT